MKKQFTFSVDTSKAYFWIILILIAYILFQYFSSPDTSKLQLENSELKGKNEILIYNESKYNESILVFKDSLKAIKRYNSALKMKLDNQKTNYKKLITEKDAKKNTIDSYDHNQLSDFLPNRYKQD